MNLEDLCIVLTELFVKDIQKIFSEYKNDHSTELRLILIKWLETGEASWKQSMDQSNCGRHEP